MFREPALALFAIRQRVSLFRWIISPVPVLDVGANIGLITYHSRDWFRSFHCFEPNPRVFNVLAANLASVFGAELHLHNFGLGDRDGTSMLSVPRYDQGAAFIA